MKVLYAASEALPFMASGGLADVAGSLPHALRRRLLGCRVVMPLYGGVSQEPEYMILSCEVDGAAATPTFGWSGHMECNDRETFSAEFIVDYVRVYDAPSTNGTD